MTSDVPRAIIASSINWKVVERFRNKFNYESNHEMLTDWIIDRQRVYDKGLRPKPYPFHRHVRLNLDKMEIVGVSSIDMVIDQGLKITKKQIQDYKDGLQETEDSIDE
jgi:hypothetical protein|tara:strand:- start:2045 stop:2368 length:324 start_codon:yes stop_codon:yes gene_type:complete